MKPHQRPYVERSVAIHGAVFTHNTIPGIVFLAAILTVLGLSACGGSNTGNISSIAISPTSASVQIATETEFTAKVTLQSSSTAGYQCLAVTWEVNGTAGGSTTVGTIVASATDPQIGVYTAPATVPAINNGQVNITAVSQISTTTTSTTNSTSTTSSVTAVTSNTAVVTITAAGIVGLSM